MSIQLYDTTLRDGAQKEGISFSVVDKLNIACKLDELGVHFIEGGWPGSNPKDIEFFEKACDLKLKNATLVAFGSTRRANGKAEDDPILASLVNAKTSVVTLVSKCSARQVTQVLETTLEENINMITDSITYLNSKGISVFIDAEHFFDGFKDNQKYALDVLVASEKAGADCLVLCDTNGGTLPDEAFEAILKVREVTSIPIGIHAHNDSELAVAVTLAAVRAGATQVQGTINGYGERCGNANLCSIIPNLKLKMGIECISDENLEKLSEVASYINEAANLNPNSSLPYVGTSAFSHKAGLHVSGLSKWSGSYQHIDPVLVGNRSRTLISELSGRSNIVHRAAEIGVPLPPKGKEAQQLLEKVKELESRGFQYENAEASFDLLVHRAQADYQAPFELVDFMVVIESRRRTPTLHNNNDDALSEAMVKVKVDGEIMHTASEGNGPVNAMDSALRKALIQFFPQLSCIHLVDYKVRILDSKSTESQVRVLIESTDGTDHWKTVGSSSNIIEASWLALADSMEYWLIKHK